MQIPRKVSERLGFVRGQPVTVTFFSKGVVFGCKCYGAPRGHLGRIIVRGLKQLGMNPDQAEKLNCDVDGSRDQSRLLLKVYLLGRPTLVRIQ